MIPMERFRLRILHISDLHERGAVERQPARREMVLGNAWKANIRDLLAEGPIDLVCFTGDIAYSGHPLEYDGATAFLGDLRKMLSLGQDRLFLVPGNHDIDRDLARDAWTALREQVRPDEGAHISDWMAGGQPLRGIDDRFREAILDRQAAYRAWLKSAGREALLPEHSAHGRLGYRASLRLPRLPFDLHVIGLDSAWLAGDEKDAGRLRLTDDQILRLATDERGKPLIGFRLALVHHPLSDLADGAEGKRLLADRVDLLLRGHLHDVAVETVADPDRELRQLAAGCLYEHHRYPNACHLLTVDLDGNGKVLEYRLRFRGWSQRGHWFDDGGLYREAPQGRLRWLVQSEPTSPGPGFPEYAVFVGREAEVADLEASLLPKDNVDPGREPPRYVLQGMPGVGKSFLVDRFSLHHRETFAGGCVRITLAPEERRDLDALREIVAHQLNLTKDGSASWELINDHLMRRPTLVHIENADGPASAEVAVQLARTLSRVPVVITGRYRGLGGSAGWRCRTVDPFDAVTARQQLEGEYRPPINDSEAVEFDRLVRELGGLPLAVHLAAGYLQLDQSPRDFLALLRQEGFRVEPSDPADPLLQRDRERAILESTFNLSLCLLGRISRIDGEASVRGYCCLGFAPRSGFGRSLGTALSGLPEEQYAALLLRARQLSIVEPVRDDRFREARWRIHPLLAEVLRSKAERAAVQSRVTEWFVTRFPLRPGNPEGQRQNHLDIEGEFDALVSWLGTVDMQAAATILEAGSGYASVNGPFRDWAGFCERVLASSPAPEIRREALLLLSGVARQAGLFERAREAAEECAVLSREANDHVMSADARLSQAHASSVSGRPAEALALIAKDALPALTDVEDIWKRVRAVSYVAHLHAEAGDYHKALAIWQKEVLPALEHKRSAIPRAITLGQVANVLTRLGQHDRALGILQKEVLPVLERAGQPREYGVALDAVAVIQSRRGQYDQALSIWRGQVIPTFDRIGNVSDRAVMQGKVAEVLALQGKNDEALRLLRDEILPAFTSMNNLHGRGVTLNQIATILADQGALDEAISIRLDEVLPLVEKLGERREIAITRYSTAQELLQRHRPEDRTLARRFLTEAFNEAKAMGLPEAEAIHRRLIKEGFVVAGKTGVRRDQPPGSVVDGRGPRTPGRNDPCHCGSGRKFKKCHGKQ